MAIGLLVSPTARAAEHPRQLRWSLSPEPMPTLRLQPERARLVLDLPREWMPATDLGRLGFKLDPRKHWRFQTEHELGTASIGTSLRLSVEDREHTFMFRLSVMPRSAVAILQFDPIPPRLY